MCGCATPKDITTTGIPCLAPPSGLAHRIIPITLWVFPNPRYFPRLWCTAVAKSPPTVAIAPPAAQTAPPGGAIETADGELAAAPLRFPGAALY